MKTDSFKKLLPVYGELPFITYKLSVLRGQLSALAKTLDAETDAEALHLLAGIDEGIQKAHALTQAQSERLYVAFIHQGVFPRPQDETTNETPATEY